MRPGFTAGILTVNLAVVLMLAPAILAGEGSIAEDIFEFLHILWEVLMVYWAFKARNRMNRLLAAERKGREWFHGLWTFLFTALYFNWKVNTLHETGSPTGRSGLPADADEYSRLRGDGEGEQAAGS